MDGSGVPRIIRNPIKIYIYFFKLFLLSVYSDTSRINMGRLTKIPEKIEIETISFAVWYTDSFAIIKLFSYNKISNRYGVK